jgi:hypothetical protein
VRREIWKWEMLGIPFIVFTGSALHFVFAWSGESRVVALIAAVNESVWEHLKLAFWPSICWSLFEYVKLRPDARSFWSAKGYAMLVAPLSIVTIFYSYTSLRGGNLLALDIATFVIATAMGQLASARLLTAGVNMASLRMLGQALLVCQLGAYATFTYAAPPLNLFEDARNGSRGLPPSSAEIKRLVH